MLQSVLNQTLAKQLSRQQTVAIMGVHTLGRALPANSGFHGESGWVVNNTHLDNEYYKQLAGETVFANGPDWIPFLVQPGNMWH